MTVDFESVRPPQTDPAEPLPAGRAAAEQNPRAASDSAVGSFGPLIGLLRGCATSEAGILQRPMLVVFAGDHGVSALGVSAHPTSETARRAKSLAGGSAPISAPAASAGIGVRVIDIAVDADLTDSGVDTAVKVRRSSGRIDIEDALSEQEAQSALTAGKNIADEEIDGGADLLIGSLCGVGASTAAAVVVAGLTGMEPVEATTRGSGIGDAAWIRKVAAVRDSLYRMRLAGTDAFTMLRLAGGADLAALTGFLAQAAVRGVPVLIDDVASTAAALMANRLAPGADAYLIATSLSPERSHRRLLDLLGRDPLTAWSLRVGSGAGAVLLVPTIRTVAGWAETGSEPESVRTSDAVADWDPELF